MDQQNFLAFCPGCMVVVLRLCGAASTRCVHRDAGINCTDRSLERGRCQGRQGSVHTTAAGSFCRRIHSRKVPHLTDSSFRRLRPLRGACFLTTCVTRHAAEGSRALQGCTDAAAGSWPGSRISVLHLFKAPPCPRKQWEPIPSCRLLEKRRHLPQMAAKAAEVGGQRFRSAQGQSLSEPENPAPQPSLARRCCAFWAPTCASSEAEIPRQAYRGQCPAHKPPATKRCGVCLHRHAAASAAAVAAHQLPSTPTICCSQAYEDTLAWRGSQALNQ